MTDIPRWPKISLLDDPDEEERARRQLNESRRQRGLPPLYPESGFPPPLPVFGGIVPGADTLPDPREIDPGLEMKPEDIKFVDGEPGASGAGDQVAQAEPPASSPPAAGQSPERPAPEGAVKEQVPAADKPAQPGKPLAYEKIRELVRENNRSKLPDEMIIAIIFKESSFNPAARGNIPERPALGLMQIKEGAWKDVHGKVLKTDVPEFKQNHHKVLDPAINIQRGTAYLQMRIEEAGGDVTRGLFGYGPADQEPRYAGQVLAATEALKQNPQNPIATLSRIYGRKYP